MKSAQLSKIKGFTLIELLVVISIIATLTVIVFVALNPGGRLQQARDARRTSDVDSILTAIHQYIIDNQSTVPSGITTAEKQIGTSVSTTACANTNGGCNSGGSCVDLASDLSKYLASMPIDPKTGTSALTGYSVVKDANGIVTVRACGAEVNTPMLSSR